MYLGCIVPVLIGGTCLTFLAVPLLAGIVVAQSSVGGLAGSVGARKHQRSSSASALATSAGRPARSAG